MDHRATRLPLLLKSFKGLRNSGGLLLILAALNGLVIHSSSSADFFVRTDGNDSSLGTSREEAWRTIERVNRASLKLGDRVLFQAGDRFSGNLRVTSGDAGTPDNPVIIASFGKGRATLSAGAGTGISVENAGGISIENLVVTGAGMTNNAGYGIHGDNTLTNGLMLEYLSIKNVEISGFGKQGILISGGPAGFRHVRVSRCAVHDNLFGGLEIAGRLSWEKPGFAHADVEVTECHAYDNPGDPNWQTRHSGSGIMLLQVDGGTISRCAAWNNGHLNGSRTGGPVGIWTCASKSVTIQHCESFGNGTTRADGGGFDIDGGSEDCVLQYNYSHDNDGPGLMVYTYPYERRPHRGNTVRFNVSENDARKNRAYAGLWIRNDNNGMTELEIHNNTIVAGPWTGQAASVYGPGLEASLRNNIFVACGGAVPLRVEQPHGKLQFQNNLYWQEGSSVSVVWDQKPYPNLEAWRQATGAETLEGQPLGLFANPKLNSLGLEMGPYQLFDIAQLRAFQPLPDSPARNGGLNLKTKFGFHATEDFLGKDLPVTGPWPLGAFVEP